MPCLQALEKNTVRAYIMQITNIYLQGELQEMSEYPASENLYSWTNILSSNNTVLEVLSLKKTRIEWVFLELER